MNPRFIPDGPALIMENEQRVLVIADLHFGAETEFVRLGIHVPSNSRERMRRVHACIDRTDPDLLVLLGDVKHNIPGMSRQEFSELPAILDSFRERVPMKVLPGNHDGGLSRFLKPGELLPVTGDIIDGTGYLHGHTLPGQNIMGRLFVLGHHHPVVHLFDEVGCVLRSQPAYLLSRVNAACLRSAAVDGDHPETRALFMPAFFELAGGLDIRRIMESKLSPLSRCIVENDAEVFLNDGTYIDTLTSLKAQDHPRFTR